MSDDATLGYCGLFCGGCGVWQANQKGKPLLGDDGGPMKCGGCASDHVTGWCADCEIKSCARGRGLRYCLECPENPCEKLTEFMNDPRYPYHLEVQGNMKRLREAGLAAWTAEMRARYRCGACGADFNWVDAAGPAGGKPTATGAR